VGRAGSHRRAQLHHHRRGGVAASKPGRGGRRGRVSGRIGLTAGVCSYVTQSGSYGVLGGIRISKVADVHFPVTVVRGVGDADELSVSTNFPSTHFATRDSHPDTVVLIRRGFGTLGTVAVVAGTERIVVGDATPCCSPRVHAVSASSATSAIDQRFTFTSHSSARNDVA
jgi:hypothetical protein